MTERMSDSLRAYLLKDEAHRTAFRRSEWLSQIRGALRRLRKARGFDQKAVAELLGRNQSEVSRLESGLGSHTTIGRIKDFVDVCDGRMAMKVWDCEGNLVLDQTESTASLEAEVAAAAEDLKLSALRKVLVAHEIPDPEQEAIVHEYQDAAEAEEAAEESTADVEQKMAET